MSSLQTIIKRKLQEILDPIHLDVINESNLHHVPANSETHFKVTLVTQQFEGKALIDRHRLVYQILSQELTKLHALSLHTYTKLEWDKASTVLSPACKGGYKL